MQIQIEKIFSNNVTTKYGAKIKYDVYVNTAEGEFKFEAWQGNWNKGWAQGVPIEFPELTDSRWQSREYNGQMYYTLKAPADASQSYGGPSTVAAISRPANIPTASPVQPQSMPQASPQATGSQDAKLDEILKIVKSVDSIVTKQFMDTNVPEKLKGMIPKQEETPQYQEYDETLPTVTLDDIPEEALR